MRNLKTHFFHFAFLNVCISECMNLTENMKKFKNILIKDIKSNEISFFSIHDSQGAKLLSRLRLNFSHLNEHKFKECGSTLCGCGLEIESS